MQGLGWSTPKVLHCGAFDGVRLAAAFSVLYSHCYALTGRSENEPLTRFTHSGIGFGDAAVYVFFAISGYLVTQSWFRDPSLHRFMARRILRIIPALIFVIVASFAVVGPLTTTLSVPDYFLRHETWGYLAKIFIYPTQYGLPSVFENNPFPNVVNGSLWSLRLEFAFYVIVAALGWVGILRWRWVNIALALICLIISMVLTQTGLFDRVLFLHQTIVFLLNAVPFFVGAALAQINLDTKIIWATAFLTLATGLLVFTPAFKALLMLALPMAAILIARYGTCDLSRTGDYSYGLYLWAFPAQQSVIHFIPNITPVQLFFIAGAAAFICAVLSWHLVEKRALALKPRKAITDY